MNSRHESPIASYRLKLNQFQNAVLSTSDPANPIKLTTNVDQHPNSEPKVNSLIHSHENNNNCINKITQNICFTKKQTYEPHQQETSK
jgi:hypothetical protein